MATPVRRGKTTVTRSTRAPRGGYGGGYRSGSVAGHAMHDQANHLGPWIVLVFVLILGIILHAFTTTAWSMFGMLSLAVVSTVGLTWSAWVSTAHRSSTDRWHNAITCGLTGAWVTLCTATGVIYRDEGGWPHWSASGFPAALWLVGGVTLAGLWNHRMNVRATDMKAPEVEPQKTPLEEAGFEGVKQVNVKRVNPYRSELTLKLAGKHTLEELQGGARKLEVAHGWPHKSVQLVSHPTANNSRFVTGYVMHSDPLKEPVAWPGLQLGKRASLFDPIARGMRGDGEVSQLYVIRPDGAKHKLTVGTNGAGKTMGEIPEMITVAALGGHNILIDTVKGTQSYGDIADVFQMFITNEGMAQALLERLFTHTVRARTDHLTREHLKAWSPKSTLGFIRIQIEEMSFLQDVGAIEALAKVLRSVGITLSVSLQRCTFDQIPTTLREQLATVQHYGILTPADAKFALPDEVLDGGADPAKWRSDQPGMHYFVQGGIPLHKQITPVRAWDDPADPRHGGSSDPNGFVRTATKVGRTLKPMCEVTATSLGELWTNRVTPAEMVRRVMEAGPVVGTALDNLDHNPVPAAPRPASGNDTDDGDDDMPTATADPSIEDGIAIAYTDNNSRIVLPGIGGLPPKVVELGECPDGETPLNPWGPLPEFKPGQHARRIGETSDPNAVSKEEYARQMEARLDELLAEGRELIVARDFLAVHERCHWSRPSIYSFLASWSAAPTESDPSPQRLAHLSSGKGWIPVKREV
jgi:hypothetical protein